jgi:hypothetical protein
VTASSSLADAFLSVIYHSTPGPAILLFSNPNITPFDRAVNPAQDFVVLLCYEQGNDNLEAVAAPQHDVVFLSARQ